MKRALNPEHVLIRQAGMLCADPVFRRFLSERYTEASDQSHAAEAVRWICGVASRADIKPGTPAASAWRRLREQFLLWRDHPELRRAAS